MNQSPAEISAQPRELCGQSFVRWLKPQRTALCRSPQGHSLILKRLDSDCLMSGDLHPDVRERLARIRELAHKRAATLISVLRDADGGVWCCWQYLEGQTFLKWVCDDSRDALHAARMLRELVIAAEGLHAQGLVHGALHDGNLLIDAGGELHVLDISPLLFYDEQEDIRAIGTLIKRALECRGETQSRLGAALLAQVAAGGELRAISGAISRAIQAGERNDPTDAPTDLAETRTRRRAMRWALSFALLGAALAASLWWALSRPDKQPPEAPPEALIGKRY